MINLKRVTLSILLTLGRLLGNAIGYIFWNNVCGGIAKRTADIQLLNIQSHWKKYQDICFLICKRHFHILLLTLHSTKIHEYQAKFFPFPFTTAYYAKHQFFQFHSQYNFNFVSLILW